MLKIGKRLIQAATEIGKVQTLADIGTDHAQLVIYAISQGYVEKAYATDISKKSLEKARRNVAEYGLSDKVVFLHGDGLEPLPEIPDIIVVAGMGANEIISMLKKTTMATKYIFIPHSDAHRLRRYLCENGFAITKDYVVYDEKFYSIITAEPGECLYTNRDIVLGRNYPAAPEFEQRIVVRMKQIEEILKKQNTTIDCLKPEIQEEYKEICEWLR